MLDLDRNRRIKYEILKRISELPLSLDATFELLENIMLYSKSEKTRYLTAQILYENFFEKSKSSLKNTLLRDLNYRFRVLNYSPSKRYNINDILNSCVEKKLNREK